VYIDMPGIVIDQFVSLVAEASAGRPPKVIALSEYISPAMEEQLSASGFAAVIQKPVRLSDATKIVMRYLL
jgi:CheY-like chemotaxis protein